MNLGHLRLVAPLPPERDQAYFCTHCGEPPSAEPPQRVCDRCGLGVVLQADAGLAPSPGAAFLVVDDQLRVCGLSAAAEDLLHVSEINAVNRPLGEFVVAANGSSQDLVSLMLSHGPDDGTGTPVVVRPPSEFGVRYGARVGHCGPPRGGLLVFDA